MMLQLSLLFVLIIFSGLFSSSEIVFIVANKTKMEVRARRKKFAAAQALSFVSRPEEYLTTVLVGNNIANIAFSSIAALLLQEQLHGSDTLITILISLVILLFGELLPKSLFRIVADAVVPYASTFLQACRILLFPFVWVTQQTSRAIISGLGFENSSVGRFLHKKDVEVLLKESAEVGEVGKEVGKKIIKVITLNDVLAKDVMKARANVVAIDVKTPVKQAWQVLVDRGYSKLLVYDRTIDNIIGVVFARDFFSRPRTISQILRETVFVPETKNCSDLFRDFRLKKISLAVVVDEFGGTAGVVTSEDILQEFLGEISDGQQEEDQYIKRSPDGTFLVNGRAEITKLRQVTGREIPEGPYDTIAGLMMHSLGRIPSEKEEVRIGTMLIHVVRATKTKIELVKIRVH
jgi:putative hemolysin